MDPVTWADQMFRPFVQRQSMAFGLDQQDWGQDSKKNQHTWSHEYMALEKGRVSLLDTTSHRVMQFQLPVSRLREARLTGFREYDFTEEWKQHMSSRASRADPRFMAPIDSLDSLTLMYREQTLFLGRFLMKNCSVTEALLELPDSLRIVCGRLDEKQDPESVKAVFLVEDAEKKETILLYMDLLFHSLGQFVHKPEPLVSEKRKRLDDGVEDADGSKKSRADPVLK